MYVCMYIIMIYNVGVCTNRNAKFGREYGQQIQCLFLNFVNLLIFIYSLSS